MEEEEEGGVCMGWGSLDRTCALLEWAHLICLVCLLASKGCLSLPLLTDVMSG